MIENKSRIYKFDNVKAVLIFLVVVGHMTTDYVSYFHCVRWFTLWIYTFHMPAFIMVSGLMHKRYITQKDADLGIRGEIKFRLDKFLNFVFCAYALKAFIYFFRLAIKQNPTWSWTEEPGIPWYLIVMAEYELVLYLTRKVNWKVMLIGSFVLSAVIGYFPAVGDWLSLSRMVNFLPLFLIGYYMEPKQMLEFCKKKWVKISAPIIILASTAICFFGPWSIYGMRSWFTGRRSYEFLAENAPQIMPYAWAIRLGVWLIAIALAVSIFAIIPDKDLGFISKIGSRTLSVYFWHRPICYWICGAGLFSTVFDFTNSSVLTLIFLVLLSLLLTILFGLSIFEHPAKDFGKLAKWLSNIKKK